MLESEHTSPLNNINVRVAVSPFCNLNCIYCDGPKSRSSDKPGAMEDFRRKPLEEGNIGIDVLLKIIETLHLAGFQGATLTGGEPFMNPKWDVIVNETAKIRPSHVEGHGFAKGKTGSMPDLKIHFGLDSAGIIKKAKELM